MTPATLAKACPMPIGRAKMWAPHLTAAMIEFGVTELADQAMFLSQLGHESGSFRYMREIWGPTPAQLRYEGRADLGNTEPGDGKRFMGRGPPQLTGRGNYRAAGQALGIDLEAAPVLVELPHVGARVAGWYWQSRGMSGCADNVIEATRRINGGMNGLTDRTERLAVARAALGVV